MTKIEIKKALEILGDAVKKNESERLADEISTAIDRLYELTDAQTHDVSLFANIPLDVARKLAHRSTVICAWLTDVADPRGYTRNAKGK